MKMCAAEEFFKVLPETPVQRLKEAAGDAAGHWEVVKLTVPEVASRMREAASLLPVAEALATINLLINGVSFPRYDFSDAWRELLVFHEHTASGAPGWPRYFSRWQTDWNNTMHYAAAMGGYSNTRQLFDKAVARLAGSTGMLGPGHKLSQTEATLLVFNGLSWARGGPVVVDFLPAALMEGSVEVVDGVSGTILPSESVADTQRQIRFLAPTIPALGYRLFSLRKASAANSARLDFPIEVKWNEKGLISSIYDREQRIEMIDPNSDRSFGGLYVSRKNGKYELAPLASPEPKISDGSITRSSQVFRKSSALRRTEVTLYCNAPYADLEFALDMTALDAPSVRYALA